MHDKLLDAREYELIHQLSLVVKQRMHGLVTGEQRSPARGGGIEFADYREYQPGDDIRQVDWAVFMRLRRLLVKLCAEERELTLILMLDVSSSMNFGVPDKLWVAKRIAAVLAGITLQGGNRTGIVLLGSELRELLPPERSQITLAGVVKALERVCPERAVNPLTCIRQFAARYGRKCMIVMLSDLLFPEWSQAVSALAATGCESYVLQIMAAEELNPQLIGEVTLVDLEGQGEVSLHIDQKTARLYRQELARFLRAIRQTCNREALGYTMISSSTPLVQVLYQDLRKGGLLC
jgi:Uncharacterized conserved protein (some members contain a von Willebrand factor type A (vWA) domain)